MKWYKKKKMTIPLGIFLVLIALRVALEPTLLGYINKELEDFSPTITGKAKGVDIKILRGVFEIDHLTLRLKISGKEFLKVQDADVSLAWREISKGNLMADVRVKGVVITVDKELPDAIKKSIPPEKRKGPKKGPPLRISRMDWKDVTVILPTDKAFTNDGPFRLSEIEGRITNLFGDTETPRSFFHVNGVGSGSAEFKAIGSANLQADPVEWDVDAQMLGFTLPSMNRFFLKKVPLSFTKGKFDLYAEVKSEEGKIRGYVKPFIEDLDFIRTQENFKGPKHWLIEVAGALGNWVLEAKRDGIVATKVPFTYDGKKFHVDAGAAMENVIEHGFDQELSPGIDENMSMQAQEAKIEAQETKREEE